MVLESVDLFFQQGSSDKEYHIQINQQNDHLYNVEAQWGRRGGALTTAIKTITDNLTDARKVFNKIRGEKVGKGYQVQGGMMAQTGVVGADVSGSLAASPVAEAPAPAAPGRRRIMWRDDILPDPVTGPNALNGLYHEEQQPALQPAPALLPNGRIQTDIHPQLLNEIMDPNGCEMYLDSDDWAMQEKMDGKHVTVKWAAGGPTTTNKKGELIVSSPSFINSITPQLRDKPSMLLDGEQIGDRFYTYDILELNGEDLRTKSYKDRFDLLMSLFPTSHINMGIERVPLFMGTDKRLIFGMYKDACKEGVVFKRLAATFTAGKGHADMFKWKWYATCSCRVSNRETGKHSVGLELLDKSNPQFPLGVWVDVGNCTIGQATALPPAHSVIEVKYLYAYRGGSLYQPSYAGPRDDVYEVDCLMTQLKYKAGT